jgi:ABC-type Fe3+/spermidine/putrescine transport system ATPase subunit
MIELKSIRKRFSDKEVLRNVTLQIQKNELLSIVGPSGCGKTTMLNIISGLCPPDEGEIYIDKILVDGKKGRKKIHVNPSDRGIGYVFQNYSLFPHMRVDENISYGLKAKHLPKLEIRNRINSLLDFIALKDYARSYPHELSGGQQQRVALARALAIDPTLLLLDEPLSALDPKTRESLRTDFKNLLEPLEVTSIYVTHDLAEACTISDRIAVMGEGIIKQIGNRDEILEQPNSRFVANFLGLNVYDGKVIQTASSPAKIKIGNVELLAPVSGKADGEKIILTIKPEDVLLSTEPLIKNPKWCGCVCNNLSGNVSDIVKMKSSAKVLVDVGFPIESELTLSSLKDLYIDKGKKVYVQFKADALNVCQDDLLH